MFVRLVVAGNDQAVEGMDARLRLSINRRIPGGHHRGSVVFFVSEEEGVAADKRGALGGLDDERDVVGTMAGGRHDRDARRELWVVFEKHRLIGRTPAGLVPQQFVYPEDFPNKLGIEVTADQLGKRERFRPPPA